MPIFPPFCTPTTIIKRRKYNLQCLLKKFSLKCLRLTKPSFKPRLRMYRKGSRRTEMHYTCHFSKMIMQIIQPSLMRDAYDTTGVPKPPPPKPHVFERIKWQRPRRIWRELIGMGPNPVSGLRDRHSLSKLSGKSFMLPNILNFKLTR
ncbi:hypothetical protein PoMZ_13606 [Pyricularia oryzae]|uniref:Uncharacterized protein n=1 Tax=Pyricularia oryzae TaxID=318829 RepID=A0A4P7NVV1_PYROR|nr:hypothetical protein PoMZ_13606 [Pyricularia oryzae]